MQITIQNTIDLIASSHAGTISDNMISHVLSNTDQYITSEYTSDINWNEVLNEQIYEYIDYSLNDEEQALVSTQKQEFVDAVERLMNYNATPFVSAEQKIDEAAMDQKEYAESAFNFSINDFI